MSKLGANYVKKAQEIENVILPLCQFRQKDTSISWEEFIKTLDHDHKKVWNTVITEICDYIFRKGFDETIGDAEFNGEIFIKTFDYCLNTYKPQGKYFLNQFTKWYSKRLRASDDSIFHDGNVSSGDEPIYNEDGNPNNNTNKFSRYVFDTYQNQKTQSTLYDLCFEATKKIDKGESVYLRLFLTMIFLLDDSSLDSSYNKFIDIDFYNEQRKLTKQYLDEYNRVKESTHENIQEKAFLKTKYRIAMSEKLGLQEDTLRKKLKKIQKLMTQIGTELGLAR